MPTLVQMLVATMIFLFVHISSLAAGARMLGVTIREVNYGIGPCLLSYGKVRIKAFPFLGTLIVKDSRLEVLPPEEMLDAFDHQPVWKQVLLPLTGPFAVLLVALLILGTAGWTSFLSGFSQIIEGALAPFSTAQAALNDFSSFAAVHSSSAVVALVLVKLSAFNLLPFAGFNGGSALMALLGWGRQDLAWQQKVTSALGILGLITLSSWLLALGFYGLPELSRIIYP